MIRLFFGFICPLLFCLITAGAYGFVFKKKLIYSLVPAFYIQCLIMLLTGMVFSSLTLGVCIGVIGSIIILLYSNKNGIKYISKDKQPLFDSLSIVFNKTHLIIFLTVYVIIFLCNYGKYYAEWDEFSHWGRFIKEMLRLDALYCTSKADIVHRDYVPVISLFEALWCKLSWGQTEANAYRGIQMLQVSMILPIFITKFGSQENHGKIQFFFSLFFKGIIAFGLPLMFIGQAFYHTIYQDLIFGILVFYCIWLVFTEEFSRYSVFVVTLALTGLIMSKMTAIAFLPAIVLLYIVIMLISNKKSKIITTGKVFLHGIIMVVIPLVFWVVYNVYAKASLGTHIGSQSYGSFSIETLIDIITRNDAIVYQKTVEVLYIDYLLHKPVFGNYSYASVVACIVLLLVVFAFTVKDKIERRKILIIDLWVFLASIMYAILMFILYMTLFVEAEARVLASYTRYMESYIIAAVFIALSVFFYYGLSRKIENISLIVLTILLLVGCVTCEECNYDQLFPGTVQIEGVAQLDSSAYADIIGYYDKVLPEDCSVLFVSRGTSDLVLTTIQYYMCPRETEVISPGSKVVANDYISREFTDEQLNDFVSNYDYLILLYIDDEFIENYTDLFGTDISSGDIIKVEENGYSKY